jgi:hypothetical protein
MPTHLKTSGGAAASKAGIAYEHLVHSVTRQLTPKHSTLPFNTQMPQQLGGSSSQHDILCNWKTLYDTPIEIKKQGAIDWMQCSLFYGKKGWQPSKKGKNGGACRALFTELIRGHSLYKSVPPFFEHSLSYEQWSKYKKDYPTLIIPIPDSVISELYRLKGSKYIQISQHGLYKTTEHDFCDFDVPRFSCETVLRVRVKVHSTGLKSGGPCKMSVIASPYPVGLMTMSHSGSSLDSFYTVPHGLIYTPLVR